MSRNDRNYKQRIANQLAENHQIHHVFQTSDLIKEVNYVREKSGVGIRGDYLFGLDNASGTVATLDAWTATKITKELGLKGEAIPRMGPGGKQYIIFKGYPGNRNYYTGTRYLATNPKVVNMAIGKLGVQSSVIQGTSITIVLYVGINILEFFFK